MDVRHKFAVLLDSRHQAKPLGHPVIHDLGFIINAKFHMLTPLICTVSSCRLPPAKR